MKESLGVKVEIDLRDKDLCLGPFVEDVEYHAFPIPSGTESTRFEKFENEYKQIFGLIANAYEAPVYLHCNHGADRTGIVVFMLLTVCGASVENIARDYMFTNFSVYGSRVSTFKTDFLKWRSKLEKLDGDTLAEKAKTWLISKGISDETVEIIRATFVENYQA